MSTRYKASEGSELGHGCCFNATIVDTMQPTYDGDGKVYGYEVICECDMKDADYIAHALNQMEG